MVQLNQQSYINFLQERYGYPGEGPLTDFLTRRNQQLYLGDRVNLNIMAQRYGTPLEISYYPQITRQVQQMQRRATRAQHETSYQGDFVYAYATKANFTADVVKTALAAGAHYETSASADLTIAGHLWQQGILPPDRLILCNGSKEPAYLSTIRRLRQQGCHNLVAILDDLDEFHDLRSCAAPLLFGVREREAGNRDGQHPGNDRFGLTGAEIDQVVAQLEQDQSPHQLVLYHAMIGSQVEDRSHFLAMLRASVERYCRLRQRVPTLRYFDFGGGVPTSGYTLDFQFDYSAFLRQLMECVRDTCAAFGVPMPDLVGEFGRYTVANHSLYLFEVGSVKAGNNQQPDWYLINGSLIVSLPDMLLVDHQQFLMLPLDHWQQPVGAVRLAGRHTCDSDDIYPPASRAPLQFPLTGRGLTVAIFGTGAYQQQLAGLGGAHHCLSPEPRRIKIYEQAGQLTIQRAPGQQQSDLMQLLGYGPQQPRTSHHPAIPTYHAHDRKAS